MHRHADSSRSAVHPVFPRLCALLLLVVAACTQAAADPDPGHAGNRDTDSGWDALSPRQKMLLTDTAAVAAITAWGFASWDYGSTEWHTGNEGWFAADTKEGGADKFGHFYSSYVLGRALDGLFHRYGYEDSASATAGALSSLGVMTLMEVGDGFSPYGFAPEDQAMNVAGAGMAWLLATHPQLDRRFAVRAEYRINSQAGGDVFTDYERWRYFLTLKLDGFDAVPEPLRWLELHAGYFARGYADENPDNDRRYAFIGMSLSLTRLARDSGYRRTATLLDYFQPPGTVLHDDTRLSR